MPEIQVVAALEKNKYYTHQDLFYVNRHSFWAAGQDSFTAPPAQDQDMFQQLTNVEPVLQGILQRRRGYTLLADFRTQSFGPNAIGSVTTTGSGNAWSNLTNVLVQDGSPATVTVQQSFPYAQAIQATNFGFNIPLGFTVVGVAVTVVCAQSAGGTFHPSLSLELLSGGFQIGGSRNFSPPSLGLTATVMGGATDTWGAGLTPAQVNDPSFGVQLNPRSALFFPVSIFSVDFISITLYTSGVGGFDTFTRSYSFRSESPTIRELVFTGPGTVVGLTETGQTVLNPIFTPTSTSTPRMALSRNFGYFADGVQKDSVKWDGTSSPGNLTQWGIDINAASAGPTGPFGPTTENDISFGGFPWFTGFAGALDGIVDSVTLPNSPGVTSNYLALTGFNFTVGAGFIVSGIQVDCYCSIVPNPGSGPNTLGATLLKNGVPQPIGHTFQGIGPTIAKVTAGGPSDLWNNSWAGTDINNANFGVALVASSAQGGAGFGVDFVQITVFGSASALIVGAPGPGNINLLSGRTYFYAFQNSKTGHTSDLSPASLNTGPLTNESVFLSGLPTSLDPQVDTIVLLATLDGGDQTFLFFLASLPIGTTTYTDNIPDGQLETSNIYQETDEFGFLHGVANNKLPPLGDFPIKHKGRIYMAKNHVLFFSKNLSDVTTSTGLTTSKWEESWPATNQIDISTRAETVQALLSDGETLWIGTERAIRRLIGDSPQNFQEPEIQFNETGVLNQEVWQVVFYEGQPIGTAWLTPDFRVIASDFNSYTDIGAPIQDVLNGINPAAAPSAHACFVSQGPADYYMLYIPTGSNTVPDTACVYNLRTKRWFIWKPTDQILTSLFNISQFGVPQWLFASASGVVDFWDNSTLLDRNGDPTTPGVPYTVTMQTSWIDMGDYNIRKFVNQIIPTTADQNGLAIKVDGASNELDFNAPLSVVPLTTVIPAAIPTDVFVPLASGPSHNRAFQFTFVSPANTIKNILTGFAIEAGQFHRY